MLGRFHEISISTADIRASVQFYERLGFTQATTTDTWTHPYGVLTDGRVFIGLHQQSAPSPALTFVRENIADYAGAFESLGIALERLHAGEEIFNEIAFRDPAGQPVRVLEARTYSPVTRKPSETSLCGYFNEFSMPSANFEAMQAFWEPMGFVATEESDLPYLHLPLTSDRLNLAFHRPRLFDRPILVFADSDMSERLAKLRARDIPFSTELPRGIDPQSNALIATPEGTALLLLESRE